MAESPSFKAYLEDFAIRYPELFRAAKDGKLWEQIAKEPSHKSSIKSVGSLGLTKMISKDTWERFLVHTLREEEIDQIELAGGSFGYFFAIFYLIDKDVREAGLDAGYHFDRFFENHRIPIFFQCFAKSDNMVGLEKSHNCIWPMVSFTSLLKYKPPPVINKKGSFPSQRKVLFDAGYRFEVHYSFSDCRNMMEAAWAAWLAAPLMDRTEFFFSGSLDSRDHADVSDDWYDNQSIPQQFHLDVHQMLDFSEDTRSADKEYKSGSLFKVFVSQAPFSKRTFIQECSTEAGKKLRINTDKLAMLLYPFEQAALHYQFHSEISLSYKHDRGNGTFKEVPLFQAGDGDFNQPMDQLVKAFEAENRMPKFGDDKYFEAPEVDEQTPTNTDLEAYTINGELEWRAESLSDWMKDSIRSVINAIKEDYPGSVETVGLLADETSDTPMDD